MKKNNLFYLITILTIAVFCLCSCSKHPTSKIQNPKSVNLVKNSSFEKGTIVPEGWKTEGQPFTSHEAWSHSEAHTGKKSLEINNISGTKAYWVSNTFFLESPLNHFDFSVWLKTCNLISIKNTNEANIEVFFYKVKDKVSTTKTTIKIPITKKDWFKLNKKFFFNNKVNAVKFKFLLSGYVGKLFIDDIKIKSFKPNYGKNLIVNSNFKKCNQNKSFPKGWLPINKKKDKCETFWNKSKLDSSLGINNTTKTESTFWMGEKINLNKPTRYIYLSGESCSENVSIGAGSYCLMFRVYYADKTSRNISYNLHFSRGTHDWEKVESIKSFNKKVVAIKPFLILSKLSGKVLFKNINCKLIL